MSRPNADFEAWQRHEDCLSLEHRDYSAARADPVAYSHAVNVSEDFACLGRLLARFESLTRQVVTGTQEEQLLGNSRYAKETHELATEAADAMAELKRRAFAEAENHKEN